MTRQPVGPAISATPTLDHAPSALRFDIGASVAFYDAPADFSTSPDTALGIEAAVGYRFTHALSGVVMTNVDLVLGDASFERGFAGAGLELSHGAIAGRLGAGLAFLTGRDETLTGLGVDATAFVGLTRSLALVLDGELAFTGQAPGLMGTFSALRLGVGIAYRPR